MNVNLIEAIWALSNLIAIVATVMSLLEARRDLAAARLSTKATAPARILTASGNMRREIFRIIANSLLLSLIIPGLFSDRPIMLSLIVAALMAVPMVLLAATLLDRRERWQLNALLERAVEKRDDETALESSVQEGLDLTRQGIVHAEAAYHEANTVNVKIVGLKEEISNLNLQLVRDRAEKEQQMHTDGSDGEPLSPDS